ncbi:MAG TPA: polyphosphate polymerase domain-containing protein [Candidatus Acidoferrum sp.]|nr:polyphosphate polymerase domain-containing protein [Candidatus Acidoferrum sp.]
MHEVKFLIPAGQAEDVRAWARQRLDPDPNAEGVARDTYRTTSLYFDTPAFSVFHRDGSYGRAKYRIRRYDAAATVFLERKLRANGVVAKRRTLVALDELCELEKSDPKWRGNWFRRRVAARGMSPLCQISYQRTALVAESDAGPIRLTVDDGLCASRVAVAAFPPLAGGVPLLNSQSILEMKFRMVMPAVFQEMVEVFGLAAQPVSKYRLAIPALGDPSYQRGSMRSQLGSTCCRISATSSRLRNGILL